MKRVELLAPAKNFQAIKAATDAADAVYFGIKQFNMRMKSENIALQDLPKIMDFCKNNNLKTYLATNILVYDNELEFLREIIQTAKDAGMDAIIAHDIAAIMISKQIGIPFHVSTQCNVSNSIEAKFYEDLGAERVILARELSLEKIKEIKRNLSKMEVEIFIHGAMCTSVSGRCYFSQDICGSEENSANRGSCVQPCRRRWWVREESGQEYIYDGVRFMNSRDLCTIAYIPKFIEAGIDAFKIEGRMRHPHYVEIVSKTYRAAMDSYYDETFDEKKVGRWVTDLKKVYNRGFTPGFYFKRMTEEDHQHKSPANLSHYRYIKVGSIEQYDPKTQLATIILDNGYLFKNADMIIMGKSTDTYVHQDLNEMYYGDKIILKSPRGTKKQLVRVKIKLSNPVIGNGQDKLYIFTDKTYRAQKYTL